MILQIIILLEQKSNIIFVWLRQIYGNYNHGFGNQEGKLHANETWSWNYFKSLHYLIESVQYSKDLNKRIVSLSILSNFNSLLWLKYFALAPQILPQP